MSSALATTMVLKFILSSGIGAKPVAENVYCGASRSLGATSKALLISLLYFVAQWAIVEQPKLCPMSTTVERSYSETFLLIVSIHSSQVGASHSCWSILKKLSPDFSK
ncbi:MAG TPA: hypothetical protein VIL78_01310 [Hanamia sp.]